MGHLLYNVDLKGQEQMKNYKIILIVFLLGVTIFSVFKYLAFQKEKYALLDGLKRIEEQVSFLEKENQNLTEILKKERQLQEQSNQEKVRLREDLDITRKNLVQLEEDFNQAKEAIEKLNSEISVLKTESSSLKEEKDRLEIQLSAAVKERDEFKARLSSLAELKKAIRELKIQMRQAHRKVRHKPLGTINDTVIAGNRGFLIKDGRSTYPAKIRIEVVPAQ